MRRRKNRVPKTPGKRQKAKGKAGTKEESKCEAEEAQHKAKETFEEESCKTETKSTKAREEVRRLEAESSLVCVMLDKNFPFQVNFFLWKHFYKYSSRKFKIRVGGKILKYGGNKKNHIFTIDNTNALKKERSQFLVYFTFLKKIFYPYEFVLK